MKAQLTFDVDNKESNDEFKYKCAINATNMYLALNEFADYLRQQWKYAEKPDDIDTIREKFYECLSNEGINLDNMSS
jgi:hypothetical protein